MIRWLALVLFLAIPVRAQEGANAVLLVAKPGLADPNFRETVLLVTQALDASTVGVILNRPSARKHGDTGEVLYSGGPVMRDVLVALYRSERTPEAAAFPVLKEVYLTMHPQIIDALVAKRDRHYRLYAGFSGWVPGQLQSELARDGWYVLAPNAELIFRADTSGMWDELVKKSRARVTLR